MSEGLKAYRKIKQATMNSSDLYVFDKEDKIVEKELKAMAIIKEYKAIYEIIIICITDKKKQSLLKEAFKNETLH